MLETDISFSTLIMLSVLIFIGLIVIAIGNEVGESIIITSDIVITDEAFTGSNSSNVSLANTDIDANSTLIQNLSDNLTEGTDYNMSNELGTILMINDTYNGVALNATYEYTSTVDRFTGVDKLIFSLVIMMLVLLILLAITVVIIHATRSK